MFGAIEKLIKKLRKKSKNLYQTGWQGGISASNASYVTYDSSVEVNTLDGIGNEYTSQSVKRSSKEEDTRIVKKPVEVVGEIITEQPVIMLNDLSKQIKIVERRIRILAEQTLNLSDEQMALGFLKSRLKYSKYKDLFLWQITTNKMIGDLCTKYKVQIVSFQSYSRNVPNEALDELEKFSNAYSKVRNTAPELKLIIDVGGKETSKDPILLAGSPFGRWWYILGAWDKEVEIVDDLVYHGK